MKFPFQARLKRATTNTHSGNLVFQGDIVTIVAHEPATNRVYPYLGKIVFNELVDTIRLKEGDFERV